MMKGEKLMGDDDDDVITFSRLQTRADRARTLAGGRHPWLHCGSGQGAGAVDRGAGSGARGRLRRRAVSVSSVNDAVVVLVLSRSFISEQWGASGACDDRVFVVVVVCGIGRPGVEWGLDN